MKPLVQFPRIPKLSSKSSRNVQNSGNVSKPFRSDQTDEVPSLADSQLKVAENRKCRPELRCHHALLPTPSRENRQAPLLPNPDMTPPLMQYGHISPPQPYPPSLLSLDIKPPPGATPLIHSDPRPLPEDLCQPQAAAAANTKYPLFQTPYSRLPPAVPRNDPPRPAFPQLNVDNLLSQLLAAGVIHANAPAVKKVTYSLCVKYR